MPTAYTRANVGGAAPIDRRTDRVKQDSDACFGERGRQLRNRTAVTQGVAEGSSPVRRPFRFIASMPTIEQPPTRWRDAVRRLEATGWRRLRSPIT